MWRNTRMLSSIFSNDGLNVSGGDNMNFVWDILLIALKTTLVDEM